MAALRSHAWPFSPNPCRPGSYKDRPPPILQAPSILPLHLSYHLFFSAPDFRALLQSLTFVNLLSGFFCQSPTVIMSSAPQHLLPRTEQDKFLGIPHKERWEALKPIIVELYTSNYGNSGKQTTLPEVVTFMRTHYGFHAAYVCHPTPCILELRFLRGTRLHWANGIAAALCLML